jgi:hypothetical protein
MDNFLSTDLIILQDILLNKLNLTICNIEIEKESAAYSAFTFEINGTKVLYREAKITPTKIGQFVTIWKRNNEGITEPFNINDEVDLVVISCRNGEAFGQFVFPKKVLGDKKIFTRNNIDGKRGIRVYPVWDIAINKQAMQTQAWQLDYFLEIDGKIDLIKTKKLYHLT